MYPILAAIFTRFVPLFDRVLSCLDAPPLRRIDLEDQWNWYEDSEAPDFDDLEGDADELRAQWEAMRPIKVPSPSPFSMLDDTSPPRSFTLRGRTVQVITKLANIVLSPSQPSYDGGVWHVEGMRDEDIVASGFYYYDQENITESSLGFRHSLDEEDEIIYEQDATEASRSSLVSNRAFPPPHPPSLTPAPTAIPPASSPTTPSPPSRTAASPSPTRTSTVSPPSPSPIPRPQDTARSSPSSSSTLSPEPFHDRRRTSTTRLARAGIGQEAC